jgi:hypothetical protein
MKMFELIALTGGFWFFCFVILVLVVGIVSAEIDSIFGGVLTIVLFALGSQLLFGIPVLQTVLADPLLILLVLLLYTMVGIAYAVGFRYPRWLKDRATSIIMEYDRYVAFAKHQGLSTDKEAFRQSNYYSEYRPGHNTDVITAWIVLWPWAVFWDLCHRPFRWVYNNLYTVVGDMLNKIGAEVTDKIIDKK